VCAKQVEQKMLLAEIRNWKEEEAAAAVEGDLS
jgi:hypothetical protein